MFQSPDQQWRDLTAHYAAMYDEELLALAADYKDLTEMAQQVLREEMRKRNLGDPTAPKPREDPEQDFRPARSTSESAEAVNTQVAVARSDAQWRRLADQYSSLDEDRIWDVAGDFENLTPVAQDALRFEMNRRNLGDPETRVDSGADQEPDALQRAERRMAAERARALAENQPLRDSDYTWKVTLAECETREHAIQLREVLRRAKVDSWWQEISPGIFRISVGADQAEDAGRIIAQPIPQDIVEQSKIEIPEYEPPQCPACGALDPVLEDTEPSNRWLCEACGKEWSEPVEEPKKA